MIVHRQARIAMAILCMATVGVRPVPLPAQQQAEEEEEPVEQRQSSADTCPLQRSDPAAGTIYSPGNANSTGRPQAKDDCVLPPEDQPQRVRGNGSALPIIGAIVAVVAGALIAKALSGNRNEPVDELMDNGPKAPVKELLGQYEVQGVVLPSWPLVVEVAADADATTFVQIVPAGGNKNAVPPMVLSDAGGAPWGNRAVLRPVEIERTERGVLAKFDLPADLGRGSKQRWNSARLSVVSGRLEGDEFRYRPLEVLALGCGPDAVGSAALEITRFEAAPQRRRASFTVSWNARRRFENVDAELVQRTRTAREVTRKVMSRQDICLTPEDRDLCVTGPSSPLPYARRGEWPAEAARELAPGQSYHMQLRAWSGGNASGGWIVGQAPRTLAW